MYRFTDKNGETGYVYSWTLTPTDRIPRGKKAGKCLRDLEREIHEQIASGTTTSSGKKITLNDVFESFVELRQDLKPTTKTNYNNAYMRHVWPELGKMNVADIRYSHIKKLYNSLVDSGVKPQSITSTNNALRAVFLVAIREGYIGSDPSKGVLAELVRQGDAPQKKKSLTIQEQETFMSYVWSNNTYKKWYPLLVFLLGTGCRIGEALSLTWDDCDFKNNLINIKHTLIYIADKVTGEHSYHISSTKTVAGVRQIPMFDAVKEILVQEYHNQLQNGFCPVEIDGCSRFVFMKKNKKLLNACQVDCTLKQITAHYNAEEISEAESQNREPDLLPHISAHILRHTFCTRLCENITNLKLIQEIMGHATITTTMDVYNDVSLEIKQDTLSDIESKMAFL